MKGKNLIKSRGLWVATAIILVAMAAGVWVWRSRSSGRIAGRPVPTPNLDGSAPTLSSTPGGEGGTTALRPGDLRISLEADRLANARLKIETAELHQSPNTTSGLQTVGTVQSDAYKETPVMPIVPGIIREVSVALGEQVTAGQKLATLFSTELAEAQTAYLKVQAEIEKHHKHFRRAAELVELGAISREEYEDTESQYRTEEAELKAARQRLVLYGLTPNQIEGLSSGRETSALIAITAPGNGVILSRAVNPGEVVGMGKEIFRLADLSTLWVIGQVYEKDLAIVRIGSPATITASAYPARKFSGRVTYIDPRIEPQTRTAQVRIEVSNVGHPLKLGMFVNVSFGGQARPDVGSRTTVRVPSAAVQLIGDRRVVFLVTNEPGVFLQRGVRTVEEVDGQVVIEEGLDAGNRVVTEGSFLLRAESLKINPAQARDAQRDRTTQNEHQQSTAGDRAETQEATILVTDRGYEPDTVRLRRGIRSRLVFIRKVEATCSTEVVIADFGIRRELPFDKPITIDFTPDKTGTFRFSCGMGMLHGTILVR